jgi:hypothetical protein
MAALSATMQELQRRKAQRSFLKNFDSLLPADPAHRPDAILSRRYVRRRRPLHPLLLPARARVGAVTS